MTSRRRARVVLVALGVALVGLGVWRGEVLYWWATTRRVYHGQVGLDGLQVRGWYSRARWNGQLYGPVESWFVGTGYQSTRTMGLYRGAHTAWNPDGKVKKQIRAKWPGWIIEEIKQAPPWWWGVTDQTEPTMPEWMKDDVQWQAALDAQK